MNRDALSRHDVLPAACALSPAPPLPAFLQGMPGPMHIQTMPFNVTDNPALSMPAGLSATGLPLSAQLVGCPFDEALLLRVGREAEKVVAALGRPDMAAR